MSTGAFGASWAQAELRKVLGALNPTTIMIAERIAKATYPG
jgi:hypothetical protein